MVIEDEVEAELVVVVSEVEGEEAGGLVEGDESGWTGSTDEVSVSTDEMKVSQSG